MRHDKKIAVMLILCVLAAQGLAWCADNSEEALIDKDALYRSYTANKWALAQVQKQFASLSAESFEKEQLPETTKKLQKLKAKSELLTRDNERIKSRLDQLNEPAIESSNKIVIEPVTESIEIMRAELTGSDWLAMSREEKEHYIDLMSAVFEDQGALFLQSTEDHLVALEQMFISDTTLLDKPLNNVFMMEIFESEKEARETIKKMYANATS